MSKQSFYESLVENLPQITERLAGEMKDRLLPMLAAFSEEKAHGEVSLVFGGDSTGHPEVAITLSFNHNDERGRAKKLMEACDDFITHNKIRCAETIGQVDSVQEKMPDLVEKICDILGYYEEGDIPTIEATYQEDLT